MSKLSNYKGKLIPVARDLSGVYPIASKQGDYCANSECSDGSYPLHCDECLFDEDNAEAVKLFEEWKDAGN